MQSFLDVFLHLDRHLEAFLSAHGLWVLALLFVVIFCETGLIVTPFLPGDSLLFAVGSLANTHSQVLSVWMTMLLVFLAATLGDAFNFTTSRRLGDRFLAWDKGRWVKPKHLERTHDFYERHGGRAVILARFAPILRTYVPFVAGVAHMAPRKFLSFNIVGAALWTTTIIGLGYAFGSVPVVKQHFELVVLGIVVISLVPVAWTALRPGRPKQASA
ncbi:MAG: VTT domain-containing protein [Polyangiaceae bacterium]